MQCTSWRWASRVRGVGEAGAGDGRSGALIEMTMHLELDGRTGLVTGASAGIGRATARILAGEGVRLAITGERREKLEELKAEIVAANGPMPAVIVHDAMDNGYPSAVAQQALDALERLRFWLTTPEAVGRSRSTRAKSSGTKR